MLDPLAPTALPLQQVTAHGHPVAQLWKDLAAITSTLGPALSPVTQLSIELRNMVPLTPGLQPDTARCPRLGWLAIAALQDLTRLCSPLTHLHVHGCLYKLNTRVPGGDGGPDPSLPEFGISQLLAVTGILAGRSLTHLSVDVEWLAFDSDVSSAAPAVKQFHWMPLSRPAWASLGTAFRSLAHLALPSGVPACDVDWGRLPRTLQTLSLYEVPGGSRLPAERHRSGANGSSCGSSGGGGGGSAAGPALRVLRLSRCGCSELAELLAAYRSLHDLQLFQLDVSGDTRAVTHLRSLHCHPLLCLHGSGGSQHKGPHPPPPHPGSDSSSPRDDPPHTGAGVDCCDSDMPSSGDGSYLDGTSTGSHQCDWHHRSSDPLRMATIDDPRARWVDPPIITLCQRGSPAPGLAPWQLLPLLPIMPAVTACCINLAPSLAGDDGMHLIAEGGVGLLQQLQQQQQQQQQQLQQQQQQQPDDDDGDGDGDGDDEALGWQEAAPCLQHVHRVWPNLRELVLERSSMDDAELSLLQPCSALASLGMYDCSCESVDPASVALLKSVLRSRGEV
ncbi:MAG: hypothetical protein WDW36_001377 [Sanguina aurantia]